MTNFPQLCQDLAALPEHERAALALLLIESLEGTDGDDLEAAWREELDRRADQIRNGTALGEAAESVMARLRDKYA